MTSGGERAWLRRVESRDQPAVNRREFITASATALALRALALCGEVPKLTDN